MLPTYVFDLDETLVHSSETPLADGDIVNHRILTLAGGKRLYVHVRPGARSLLNELLKLQKAGVIRVGIWTAATAEYARKMVALLLGDRGAELSFLRTRRDCVDIGKRGRPYYVKDLRDLVPPSQRVVIVDDNIDTIEMNRRGGYSTILATPFHGKRSDRELSRLLRGITAVTRQK
jgi:TFIIF-interacting CTD phosphatase-like protein